MAIKDKVKEVEQEAESFLSTLWTKVWTQLKATTISSLTPTIVGAIMLALYHWGIFGSVAAMVMPRPATVATLTCPPVVALPIAQTPAVAPPPAAAPGPVPILKPAVKRKAAPAIVPTQ